MITFTQFKADPKAISDTLHDSAMKHAQSTGVPWKKAAPPRESEFFSILKNLTASERKLVTAKSNRVALEQIAHRETCDNAAVLEFMKNRSSEWKKISDTKSIPHPKRLYAKPWKRKTAMILLAMLDYKPAKKSAAKKSKPAAKKAAA